MTTTERERARKEARGKARMDLEDSVCRALEAGLTPSQITEEVQYTLENAEEL